LKGCSNCWERHSYAGAEKFAQALFWREQWRGENLTQEALGRGKKADNILGQGPSKATEWGKQKKESKRK